MSKELRALNRIKDFMSANAKHWKQDIGMIETALKRLEQQDGVIKILKEVIGFKIALPYIKPCEDNVFDIMSTVRINIQRGIENTERELLRQWVLETCFPKEIKALEIIKEYIFIKDKKIYARECGWKLTQEKYELLKEILL